MSNVIVIRIEGMDCSSCVMNIDGALEDIDGIEEARTNFAKSRTKVTFDKSKISSKKVITIIEEVGYQAVIIE